MKNSQFEKKELKVKEMLNIRGGGKPNRQATVVMAGQKAKK